MYRWKPYGDRYKVYEDGYIWQNEHQRNGKNGSIRKVKAKPVTPTYDRGRYIVVSLYGKTKRLHIILAELFIPNPNNYSNVTFIDKDQSNIHSSNLKWISKSERTQLNQNPIEEIHTFIQTINNPKNKPSIYQSLTKYLKNN